MNFFICFVAFFDFFVGPRQPALEFLEGTELIVGALVQLRMERMNNWDYVEQIL